MSWEVFCDVLVTLVVGHAAAVAENGVAADENTAADNDRDDTADDTATAGNGSGSGSGSGDASEKSNGAYGGVAGGERVLVLRKALTALVAQLPVAAATQNKQ